MSEYTTELHNILLSGFDLGMDTYPIFSEGYRDTLNQKIFNHYKFHEIGFETAGRFKHYLNTTMNEIMPYYNQLYQSELLSINPLLTFERKTDATKDTDSTSTKNIDNVASSTGNTVGTTNNTSNQDSLLDTTKGNDSHDLVKSKDIHSDTPQSILNDLDIETNYFASDVNIITNDNTSSNDEVLHSVEGVNKVDTGNNTVNMTTGTTTNEDATETSSINEVNVVTENGFEIPLSELIIKYRETFLNIDLMIIKDLKDLFLLIY